MAERSSNPNIFILMNRWDATADEPEGAESVIDWLVCPRRRHIFSCAFYSRLDSSISNEAWSFFAMNCICVIEKKLLKIECFLFLLAKLSSVAITIEQVHPEVASTRVTKSTVSQHLSHLSAFRIQGTSRWIRQIRTWVREVHLENGCSN